MSPQAAGAQEEITEDESAAFDELCGEVGTLVVWSKCDRLLSKAFEEPGGTQEKSAINYRARKLRDHCALIFHKYLNVEDTDHNTVNISINGENVNHWNPFYPEKSEQVLPEIETKLPMELLP